jgi:hypothetical protein
MRQGVRQLQAVALHLVRRHTSCRNFQVQPVPFHIFHRNVGLTLNFTDFVHRANVGMIQCGNRSCFLQGSFVAGRAPRGQRFQEFQGHIALQFFILRAIHHTHATFAQLLLDNIVAESLTQHGDIVQQSSP